MPTITIRIEVPESTEVTVERSPEGEASRSAAAGGTELPDAIERYWRTYLSDNGRELYEAAAAIERENGPGFTLNDIADRLGREYSSAQSIHRTTGRSARKWKDDTGTKAPIRLRRIEYQWDASRQGRRTTYRLPDGVAYQIASL